jgi:histidinol-phosphate/aromatic aminotransferase/cobyric acid decarboxylase-like protein
MDYVSLARPAVRLLHEYSAGTTIDQAKRRFELDRVIKLSSNENPRGSSPKALAATPTTIISICARVSPNRTDCASRTRFSVTAATRFC